jgi:hypothetical protein
MASCISMAQAVARFASSSRPTGAPKDREDGVADELVDGALVLLDDLGHGGEVVVDDPHHLLGRQPLGECRETAEVGHQDGDRALVAAEARASGGFEDLVHDLVGEIAAEGGLDQVVAAGEARVQALHLVLGALQGQLGLDAREADREVDGLGDVVVGPELQGLDDVVALVLGRGHDDGQVGARLGLTDRAQDVDPRNARHHDVEEDEVEGVL